MNKVYLLLGGNQGNRTKMLNDACKLINTTVGSVTRRSKIYETAAWGFADQPDFLNQVIVCETKLPARKILDTCLSIEKQLGRRRSFKNAPRSIDIDILFFNKLVISEKGLSIPHPALHLRRFVLVPLNELSPGLIHPNFNKTIHQLLLECPDKLNVNKF